MDGNPQGPQSINSCLLEFTLEGRVEESMIENCLGSVATPAQIGHSIDAWASYLDVGLQIFICLFTQYTLIILGIVTCYIWNIMMRSLVA